MLALAEILSTPDTVANALCETSALAEMLADAELEGSVEGLGSEENDPETDG
jgi:hypothetical protein